MNSDVISKGIISAIAKIVGITILCFFLFEIRTVLAYIVLASVTSLTGRPIVLFLESKLRFSNTLAVIITMTLLFGFLIGLLGLLIPLVIEQGQNLALLDIQALESNIENLFNEVTTYLQREGIKVKETSFKDLRLFSNLNFKHIPEFLNILFSSIGSFSIGLFSILFISFFFLKDSKLVENTIVSFVPTRLERRTRHSIIKTKNLLSRYFVGLFLQISILFVIYTVVLLIFGIEHPLIIAFICALLNLIPYIGPLISAVLMIFLTMSSNLGQSFSEVILPKTIYVMIGFTFAQLIDNFFSQPLIFSRSVKSHPLEIFLVILIAGLLFGVVGMVIAIPAYTTIKVVLKEFLSENKFVKKLTKDL